MVHIDGEERPASEVDTRCSECGIPELDFDYCESCITEQLKTAIENDNKDKIREVIESRLYSAGTKGRTAQFTDRSDKKDKRLFDATIWTSEGFRAEAEWFAQRLNRDTDFNITIDFCRGYDEFRKYCRVIV